MNMQLAFTAIGDQSSVFVVELTAACRDCQCNIMEARASTLGNQATVYMLVDGNWNHIAKLENILDTLAQKNGLMVHYKRAESNSDEVSGLPYSVDLFAKDELGAMTEPVQFFTERQILILDLACSTYPATHTNVTLLSAHLVVAIPTEQRVISLRDEFLEFCDQFNFDAIFEPIKR